MKNLLKAKSEFRKKGVTLIADKEKSGGGGSWKFASEDALVKAIQKPLTECGLELVTTMEYLQELGVDTVKVTLAHTESGESTSSQISLPAVEPRKDKNGNAMYLDAEIERGKQFGYWSRTLAIRLLGLSDIDAEDVRNRPEDLTVEPEDTMATLEAIKKSDPKTKEQLTAAKKEVGRLFSIEDDAGKKEAIKLYGLELKEALDAIG